jgi:hypothetical protein
MMLLLFVFAGAVIYYFMTRPEEGDDCEGKDENGNYVIDDKGKCVLKSCNAGYSKSGKKCIANTPGEVCTPASPVTGAKEYKYGSTGLCVPDSCIEGYEKTDNMCSLLPVLATGGTKTTAGGYTIHTFTTGGDFTVTRGGECDVLVVAGGGGGSGRDVGGGGGAGGLIYKVNETITPGSYTIEVGAGGVGQADGQTTDGMQGGNSSVFGLNAIGGGAGKVHDRDVPELGVGGSGGGGSGLQAGSSSTGNRTGALGTGDQGNKGGDGKDLSTDFYGGGGGGGAGENGKDADDPVLANRHNGGDGKEIFGTFYAGGGGGAGHRSQGPGREGKGGKGGGGDCNQNTTTSTRNGKPNTGGGGGASRNVGLTGGSGGSGIVIIRYLSA